MKYVVGKDNEKPFYQFGIFISLLKKKKKHLSTSTSIIREYDNIFDRLSAFTVD